MAKKGLETEQERNPRIIGPTTQLHNRQSVYILDTPEKGSGAALFRGSFREAVALNGVPIEARAVTQRMTLFWGLQDEVDPTKVNLRREDGWINSLAVALSDRMVQLDEPEAEICLTEGTIRIRAYMSLASKENSEIGIVLRDGTTTQKLILGIEEDKEGDLSYKEKECSFKSGKGQKRDLRRGEKMMLLAWIPTLMLENGLDAYLEIEEGINEGMELTTQENLEDLVADLQRLPEMGGGKGIAVMVSPTQLRGLWLEPKEEGESLMISASAEGQLGGLQMSYRVRTIAGEYAFDEEKAVRLLADGREVPMDLVEKTGLMGEVPQMVEAIDAYLKNEGRTNG